MNPIADAPSRVSHGLLVLLNVCNLRFYVSETRRSLSLRNSCKHDVGTAVELTILLVQAFPRMDPTPPLRDNYGLEVNRDYAELLQTYTPLWISAAVRNTAKWRTYLQTAAEQLGILEAAATANLNLHDASCSKLIASVLREVLLLGERHAPDLFESLVELVADGVPNDLRPHVWPALLGARKHCPAGHYSRLVALHQREWLTW